MKNSKQLKTSTRNDQKNNTVTKLAALALLIMVTHSKRASKSIYPHTFKRHQCVYLDKFHTTNGIGLLESQLAIKKPYRPITQINLRLQIFETPLKRLETLKNVPKNSTEICELIYGQEDYFSDLGISSKKNAISSSNSKFGTKTAKNQVPGMPEGAAGQSGALPRQFYFYVCDCENTLKNIAIDDQKYTKKSKLKLKLKLKITTEDEKHFGADQTYEIYLLGGFLLVFLLIIAWGTSQMEKRQKNEDGEYDMPFSLLLAITFIQICGIAVRLAHNLIFLFNGTGFSILDLAGRCWIMAGDSCVWFFLIFVARGYGIKFRRLRKREEPVLLGVVVFIVSRYAWTFYSWMQTHEDHNHALHGVVGFFEVIISGAKYLWFLASLRTTKLLSTKKLRQFRVVLFKLGTFILVFRPSVLLLAQRVEKVHQHFWVWVAIWGSAVVNMSLLLYYFNRLDGIYRKVALVWKPKKMRIQYDHLSHEEDEEGNEV